MGLFGGDTTKKTEANTTVTTTTQVRGITGRDAVRLVDSLAAATVAQQRANAQIFAAAQAGGQVWPMLYMAGGFILLMLFVRRL